MADRELRHMRRTELVEIIFALKQSEDQLKAENADLTAKLEQRQIHLDSDYRGELKVPMINLGKEAYTIQPGERVAQLCIAPVYTAAFVPVQELGDTTRGAGGFGSTGK